MNIYEFFLGILFLIGAYLVGIKKQTWLLTGFNQHRVRNKEKLAKITGGYLYLPLAIVMLISSFINYPYEDIVLIILIITSVAIAISYVNAKMVE